MSLRATSLPDPGDPGIVTLAGALASLGFALVQAVGGGSIEAIKDHAFIGGLAGIAIGLVVYAMALIVS